MLEKPNGFNQYCWIVFTILMSALKFIASKEFGSTGKVPNLMQFKIELKISIDALFWYLTCKYKIQWMYPVYFGIFKFNMFFLWFLFSMWFSICLVTWPKISTMITNVWWDVSCSCICTGMWPITRLFCFTIIMCHARGYKKWLFLTEIQTVCDLMVWVKWYLPWNLQNSCKWKVDALSGNQHSIMAILLKQIWSNITGF